MRKELQSNSGKPDIASDGDFRPKKITPRRRIGDNHISADNNPDDAEEDLDTPLTLHFQEIAKIPTQIANHTIWGQEISAGRIALQSLSILSQSELLTPSQKKRVTIVLGNRNFLLSRFYLRVKQVQGRLEKNDYGKDERQAETLRKLDKEFMQTVSGNERLTHEILQTAKRMEDVGQKQVALEQFIEHQIKFASQGKESWDKLVESNLRLALAIARKYQHRRVPLEDLVQYGNEGLMIAAAGYDSRRGYQFSTYAHWWITQAIERSIDHYESIIRMPTNVHEKIRKIFRNQDGDLPENLAIAIITQNVFSLDMPIYKDKDKDKEGTLKDIIPNDQSENPEEVLNQIVSKSTIEELLSNLDARERKVLELRYGLTGDKKIRTLEEVGIEFGVTRERIRQIEQKALRKLRGLVVPEKQKNIS